MISGTEIDVYGNCKAGVNFAVSLFCKEKTGEMKRLREGGMPQNRDEKLLLPHAEHDTLYSLQEADVSGTLLRKEDLLNEIRFEYKVYPLSRTFLSNRQTVTVTFPADNFLFPIGCMK